MSGARSIGRLLAVLRHERARMAAGVGLAVMAGLAGAGLMAVSGWFIAAMALAGAAGAAMNYYTPAALIRLFAIVRSGGRYGERLATHDATLRGLTELRTWLLRRIIPLAPARLSAVRSATLFARLRADVDALEQWYLAVLVPGAVALAGVCVASIALVWLLPLALLAVIPGLLVVALLIPYGVNAAARADARAAARAQEEVRTLCVDAVRGHAELLMWGQIARQAGALARADAVWVAHRRRLARREAFAAALPGFVAQASVAGVIVCAYAADAQRLAPALLVMLVLLVLSAYELIAPVPEAMVQGRAAHDAAGRVFALADQPPAVTEPAQSAGMTQPPAIRFAGVRLRYAEDAPWALDGVELAIRPGERVAIVGPSGAGKTSLIGALQKFYPLGEGSIEFGGQPLAALRGDDVRRQIAVIAQRPMILNRSLRDNLLLAAPKATTQERARAVQASQLEAFVAGLPQG
ncbi:MAG: ATP-binding cassette domain-containing protein, partial [Gammaproteobacteria bacterium]|nr:ATP-binding cassette domain-containing protein [Gammaproteobacteria bacterium]